MQQLVAFRVSAAYFMVINNVAHAHVTCRSRSWYSDTMHWTCFRKCKASSTPCNNVQHYVCQALQELTAGTAIFSPSTGTRFTGVTYVINIASAIDVGNVMHNLNSSSTQELAPEVAARIAEAERIAKEAEAEAAAFAEQAAAVQAEHDLKRQEQLQACLPTALAAVCLHIACTTSIPSGEEEVRALIDLLIGRGRGSLVWSWLSLQG